MVIKKMRGVCAFDKRKKMSKLHWSHWFQWWSYIIRQMLHVMLTALNFPRFFHFKIFWSDFSKTFYCLNVHLTFLQLVKTVIIKGTLWVITHSEIAAYNDQDLNSLFQNCQFLLLSVCKVTPKIDKIHILYILWNGLFPV